MMSCCEYHQVDCSQGRTCPAQNRTCPIATTYAETEGMMTMPTGCSLKALPDPKRQPLPDDQIEDMRGDANRGSNIGREDYFKAVRDAEAAHGIRGAA